MGVSMGTVPGDSKWLLAVVPVLLIGFQNCAKASFSHLPSQGRGTVSVGPGGSGTAADVEGSGSIAGSGPNTGSNTGSSTDPASGVGTGPGSIPGSVDSGTPTTGTTTGGDGTY